MYNVSRAKHYLRQICMEYRWVDATVRKTDGKMLRPIVNFFWSFLPDWSYVIGIFMGEKKDLPLTIKDSSRPHDLWRKETISSAFLLLLLQWELKTSLTVADGDLEIYEGKLEAQGSPRASVSRGKPEPGSRHLVLLGAK